MWVSVCKYVAMYVGGRVCVCLVVYNNINDCNYNHNNDNDNHDNMIIILIMIIMIIINDLLEINAALS